MAIQRSKPGTEKDQLRREVAEGRSSLKRMPERKAQLDAEIVTYSITAMTHFGALNQPIAAYNPLPSEPGPADYAARLNAHAQNVWLPISLAEGVLAWASTPQDGQAERQGALGITEPQGPRFNSNVLRACALVIAPAMAVDKHGLRLGKGAGYYDRALAGLDVPVAAVVYDTEFVAAVPHEAHDAPVDAVITPSGFFPL
ncbi:5-formyltetrahydrofolate cyclo-ligase [Corynebacterium glaucum]|uniref:5-formyltetrahydrofolate cyclo-ligase n=1 Tax=Corynebacterium glaucum TaxID=187491 RepID=UPI0026585D2F|nr:5-formyltetrahydrofolate cyclo-ligase [Corynebacterium glaucum]